jgi:alpha-tubulin suppressor-like RCC1 family protein
MAIRSDSVLRIGRRLAVAFLAVVATGCLQEHELTGLPHGALAALSRVGADELVGAVSQPLERPLVVKVTNVGGDSVPGVTVSWAVTAGGGSVSPATSTTDSLGQAQTTWTIGPIGGINNNSAVATVQGFTPVTFTATGAASVAGVWSRLAAGVNHTCGLTVAGAFYCWGSNFYGEFGNGTTTVGFVPTAGATGLELASFGVGQDYTCGVTMAGAGYCWGNNQVGTFGSGWWDRNPMNPISHPRPIPVSGGLMFASISTGYLHACGVTTTGAAYCWGDDLFGEVGDGATALERLTPTLVQGNLTFTSISAGATHTCGLTTEGRVYCWGDGGLVGDGTSLPRLTPVAVASGIQFVSVTAGTTHTCALATTGAAYCWGLNASGEVGDSTAWQRLAPAPVAGGIAFANISAGYDHTCGVSKAGVAYCWGNNDNGALGVGDKRPRLVPTAVHGGVLFAGVTAGLSYSCGWSSAGGAFCWGSNSALGDGSSIQSLLPVRVFGP